MRKELEVMRRQLETKSVAFTGEDVCATVTRDKETVTKDHSSDSVGKRIEVTLKSDGGLAQLGKFELKDGGQQCVIS